MVATSWLSPANQHAFGQLIRQLQRAPLPDLAHPDRLDALRQAMSQLCDLQRFGILYAEGSHLQLFSPLGWPPPWQKGDVPNELTLTNHLTQMSQQPGWCQAEVGQGEIRRILALTQPQQQPLLQLLLESLALNFSHQQASRRLELCRSPLLHRVPQWQEKMESFIRLMRLAQSLPPTQLCAQFESSLRYWMGTQSLQVLQRDNHQFRLLYPSQPALPLEQLQAWASKSAFAEYPQGVHHWYGLPLFVHRSHAATLLLCNQRPLTQEDRLLLTLVTEQLGGLLELIQLRQRLDRSRRLLEGQDPQQQLRRHNHLLLKQLRQRDELERQLLEDAQRDPLTGLGNRSLFLHHLQQALHHYHRYPDDGFAVLLLDLVSLRQVNQEYGDGMGDLLLKTMARLLQESVRQNDLVARLSGDEFVLLLDYAYHTETITPVISRILDRLQDPLLLNETPLQIRANMGVATVSPEIKEAGQMLHQADMALFQAKRSNQGHAVFYSELCDVTERPSPEQALVQALQSQRILPYFQPIHYLADGEVHSVEVLARWLTQEGELKDAVEFVPLAEQSGLVLEIDRLILRHVCGLLHGWLARLPERHGLRLAVNLSGKHLLERERIEALLAIINEQQVSPRRLIFEFRERDLVRLDSRTLGLLHELRAKGIEIAVDDFGTGYSSLNALFHYPVDYIKVDDSFTHRLDKSPRDRTLIRTIRDLGRDLGMGVIIEGVETPQQQAMLLELGCELGQGYKLSLPMPADAVLALLMPGPRGL